MDEKARHSRNGPYDLELLIPVAILAFVVLTDIFGIAAVIAGTPELILAVPGSFVAGFFIWVVVRRVNGYHDPRNVEPPSNSD
jgi:hypothetical protein